MQPKKPETPEPGPLMASASSAPAESLRFKVRATRLGYYDDKRRRAGDVFWVSAAKTDTGKYVAFAPSWMERVPDSTPESITTGQQELRRQHDEILASKAAGALAASAAGARSPLEDE